MTDRVKYVQARDYRLHAPIGPTDTTLTLSSMNLPTSGNTLSMSDFGEFGIIVCEPDNNSRQETIFFSGLTVNPNNTVTLSGLTRGIAGVAPYTQNLSLRKSHGGGTVVRVTNAAAFYSFFASKLNDETIEELWKYVILPQVNDENTLPVYDADLITKKFLQLALQYGVNTPSIVTQVTATTGSTPSTSLTTNITIPAGVPDGILVVSVSTQQDRTVSGVTIDGVALTQAASHTRVSGNLRTEIWYLLNPASGTDPVVVTMSGSSNISFVATLVQQVDQTNPINATGSDADGSSTAPSTTITTADAGTLVVDSLAFNTGTTLTAGTYQTISGSNIAGSTKKGAQSIEATFSVGPVTSNYTIDVASEWAMVSVALRGSALAGNLTVEDSGVVIETGVHTINFTGTPVTVTNTSTGVVEVAVSGTGGGSGSVVQEVVTQTAHGFISGDVLGSNNTAGQYKKVISATTDNMPIGFAVSPITTNTFTLATSGFATITPALLSSFSDGDVIWHSTTVSGGITATKPTSGVVRKLGIVIDKAAGKIYVDIDTGFVGGGGSVAGGSIQLQQSTGLKSTKYNSVNDTFYQLAFPNGSLPVYLYTKNVVGTYQYSKQLALPMSSNLPSGYALSSTLPIQLVNNELWVACTNNSGNGIVFMRFNSDTGAYIDVTNQIADGVGFNMLFVNSGDCLDDTLYLAKTSTPGGAPTKRWYVVDVTNPAAISVTTSYTIPSIPTNGTINFCKMTNSTTNVLLEDEIYDFAADTIGARVFFGNVTTTVTKYGSNTAIGDAISATFVNVSIYDLSSYNI